MLSRLSLALIVLAALALAVALSGCGSGSTGGTDASGVKTSAVDTTGSASSTSDLCASFKQLDTDVTNLTDLSSGVSESKVKSDISQITKTADQIKSEAKDAASKNRVVLTAAIDAFATSVESAKGQSVPEALVTLGTAASTLQVSVNQVATSLKCPGS